MGNFARTNHLDLQITDCVVGVFYGTPEALSASYRKINEDYPVYIGASFWHRLTGDKDFYSELINAFAEVAGEMDGTVLLQDVIAHLANEIEKNPIA